MTTLAYIVAYAGLIVGVGAIAYKVLDYLKKPVHLRWELYPVASEAGDRPSYGGSYLEEVDWWTHKQQHSFVNMVKGLCQEMLLMHATYEHNYKLWVRTYPMHLGFYFLMAAMGIAFGITILNFIVTISFLNSLAAGLINMLGLLAFLGMQIGCLLMLHRRRTEPGLKDYTMPEHIFNLVVLLLLSFFGLITWWGGSFGVNAMAFTHGMLTFSTQLILPTSFNVFMIWLSVLAAYIPLTHMAHFFMKYFLWHDIRWGDQPTRDNPKIMEQIGKVLQQKPDWSAKHIDADGKKNWAEIATTNPTEQPEKKADSKDAE